MLKLKGESGICNRSFHSFKISLHEIFINYHGRQRKSPSKTFTYYPRTCKHGGKYLADVIKLMILTWGVYPGGPSGITSALINEKLKQQSWSSPQTAEKHHFRRPGKHSSWVGSNSAAHFNLLRSFKKTQTPDPIPRDHDVIHLGSGLGTGILERSLGDSDVCQDREPLCWGKVYAPRCSLVFLVSSSHTWTRSRSGDVGLSPGCIQEPFERTCAWTPLEPIKSKSLVVVPGPWDFNKNDSGSQSWEPLGWEIQLQMGQLKVGRSVHRFPWSLESEVALGISNPLPFLGLHGQAAMAVAGDIGMGRGLEWGSPQRPARGWGVLAPEPPEFLHSAPLPLSLGGSVTSVPFPLNQSDPRGRFSERGKQVRLFVPKVVALRAEQPRPALATAVFPPVPSLPDMASERVQLLLSISHWKGRLFSGKAQVH